jgi:phosphoribosylformylglycinamidine synthase
MSKPRVAIVSFPGNNCEVESIRAIKNAGMEPVFHKWNDDLANLGDIGGYFLPGGFSYEDRGRAGMISARDPIMDFIREEAAKGKVVIGNCNGAQVLVESGLIPNAEGLEMSLAQNAVQGEAVGFLSEWIWVTAECDRDRCATSDWEGVMHMPIAHGEGRFTTKDRALWKALIDNDQMAFSYCDEAGNAAPTIEFNPNGSELATAGICNPEGNVVALMPHPERTLNGDPYFASMKKWIESHPAREEGSVSQRDTSETVSFTKRESTGLEIFIDTKIVNNEERTVEQAASRLFPNIVLKQMKYFSIPGGDAEQVLGSISLFNSNKEIAYIRRGDDYFRWEPDDKKEVPIDSVINNTSLLRRNEPDTGSVGLKEGSETGVCYVCLGVSDNELTQKAVTEIFGNPHSSTLELL